MTEYEMDLAKSFRDRKLSVIDTTADVSFVPVFNKELSKIKDKSNLRDLMRKLFFFSVFYGVVFG